MHAKLLANCFGVLERELKTNHDNITLILHCGNYVTLEIKLKN